MHSYTKTCQIFYVKAVQSYLVFIKAMKEAYHLMRLDFNHCPLYLDYKG